jgi:UDP-N-acetylmuramoylalanine-D-glutamate ligase
MPTTRAPPLASARRPGRFAWSAREPRVFIDKGWVAARLNGHIERICPVADVGLRGGHNLENVLAATACVLWTGMAPEAIRRGIAAFRGGREGVKSLQERHADIARRNPAEK